MKRVLLWSAVFLVCLGCRGEQGSQNLDPAKAAPATPPSSSAADAGSTVAGEIDAKIRDFERIIETGNWSACSAATRHIGGLGDNGRPAIPMLRALMNDDGEYWLVRSEAVCALAAIGPETLPDIRSALTDRPPRLRWAAAYALGRSGAAPQEVVPLLEVAIQDSNWLIRTEAARSLASQGPSAVPALQNALKDDDPRVQAAAAWSLGQLGREAKAAVPDLQEALSEEDWLVRSAAVYALGHMGTGTIPDILAETESPDWGVRAAASQALRELGRSDLIQHADQVSPEADRSP
jgi:HEAT repeat protein